MLPVGAATGVESIAYTPVVHEHLHVPTGDQVLDHDTTVWATDGEVGHVVQVRVHDETRQIESLMAERGALRKHARFVPADAIDTIGGEAITLAVGSGDLQDPFDV